MKEGIIKSNVKKNEGETRKAPAPPPPRAKKEEELLHQRVKELEMCLNLLYQLNYYGVTTKADQDLYNSGMKQAEQLLNKDKE